MTETNLGADQELNISLIKPNGDEWVMVEDGREKVVGYRALRDFELGKKIALAKEERREVREFIKALGVSVDEVSRVGLGERESYPLTVYHLWMKDREGKEVLVKPVAFKPLLIPDYLEREEGERLKKKLDKYIHIAWRQEAARIAPGMVYHSAEQGVQTAADFIAMAKAVGIFENRPDEEGIAESVSFVHDSGEWISLDKEIMIEVVDTSNERRENLDLQKLIWEATKYDKWPEPSDAWKSAMERFRKGDYSKIKNDLVVVTQMGADFFQALTTQSGGIALAADFIARFGSLNSTKRITWEGGIGVDQNFGFLVTTACTAVWPIVEKMGDESRARAWKGFMALQQELMPGVDFGGVNSMSEFLIFMEKMGENDEFSSKEAKDRLLGPTEETKRKGIVIYDIEGEDWSRGRLIPFYKDRLDDYEKMKKVVEHRLKK